MYQKVNGYYHLTLSNLLLKRKPHLLTIQFNKSHFYLSLVTMTDSKRRENKVSIYSFQLFTSRHSTIFLFYHKIMDQSFLVEQKIMTFSPEVSKL